MSKRSVIYIALACLTVLTTNGLAAGQQRGSILRRHLDHFSIGKTSALNALLWLGNDEGVCFGIEFMDGHLTRDVQLDLNQTTIGDAIRKILGSSVSYDLSESNGAVLVRKRGASSPTWLDHRLRKFEVPRMELIMANVGLSMRLDMDLNPSLQGFVGSVPTTSPIDEVGPFNERGRTVRQLLIKIATASHGASWYPSTSRVQISFPASVNQFWTFAAYRGIKGERPK